MEIVQKFKRGDTVRLKSGGPPMTVDDYHIAVDVLGAFKGESRPDAPTAYVNCTWFDKNNRKFGRFHQDLLESASIGPSVV